MAQISEVMVGMNSKNWKDIAARKQAQRETLIPEAWKIDASVYEGQTNVLEVPNTCGVLSKQEIQITSNYDAVDLLAEIRLRTFSVEEVTLAFCKRAAIAQQLVRGIIFPHKTCETDQNDSPDQLLD